eukprot:CAMPEP_0172452810 /NCGR_PEP_ID=MMETSP1065-20121228/10364_1 /TAXON_ID=265537 /ORGANISM="Amphiprora paludosa, Strain CCMP125" /LENGTH=132 /DNA_ID=CAMNT_0013204927 /DNA_START=187 /DNA_END=582 /DNA_ORIENTATION=+
MKCVRMLPQWLWVVSGCLAMVTASTNERVWVRSNPHHDNNKGAEEHDQQQQDDNVMMGPYATPQSKEQVWSDLQHWVIQTVMNNRDQYFSPEQQYIMKVMDPETTSQEEEEEEEQEPTSTTNNNNNNNNNNN